MLKINTMLTSIAILLVTLLAMSGCDGGGGAPSAVTPPVVAASATWLVPDGSTMNATQMATLFDTNQLYFNVQSAARSNGEIRGEINPSSAIFLTDTGNPFAPNPADNPVTYATILAGDQVRPRNVVTRASGYGSVTLNPLTKELTGFIVTSGIVGNAAQIHDGLTGSSGAIVLTLEGGPVVWTIPANTVLSDAQIARLSAGAYYFDVHSDAFPDGEIRGQLDQQVRCASLTGSGEVPPVTTSATGVGFLALNPSTLKVSGFVKVDGLSSAVSFAGIHTGAAGTNGIAIIALSNSGNGIWSVPPNTVLSSAQVTNFNNDELYFNIHTQNNTGGELRGQLLNSSVRIGTANLAGAKEAPPVQTQATGTGIIALNSVTGQVSSSVKTDGVNGTSAQIHSGSTTTTGPPLITLTTASPVTVAPAPGISFALDIQPIFNANCTNISCHVTGGTGPISLQPSVAYVNTFGLVVPGDSASSYFVQRLTGAVTPVMPLNRPPLSTTSLDLIKKWIDNGALDN